MNHRADQSMERQLSQRGFTRSVTAPAPNHMMGLLPAILDTSCPRSQYSQSSMSDLSSSCDLSDEILSRQASFGESGMTSLNVHTLEPWEPGAAIRAPSSETPNEQLPWMRSITSPTGNPRLTALKLKKLQAGRWGVSTCCSECGNELGAEEKKLPFNYARTVSSQRSKQSQPCSVVEKTRDLVGYTLPDECMSQQRTDTSIVPDLVSAAFLVLRKSITNAVSKLCHEQRLEDWKEKVAAVELSNVLHSGAAPSGMDEGVWQSHILPNLERPVAPGSAPQTPDLPSDENLFAEAQIAVDPTLMEFTEDLSSDRYRYVSYRAGF